jgi:glycosyltransferase involved in cell wall biosynthesis
MAVSTLREVALHRPTEIVCGHINLAPLAWVLRALGVQRVSLIAHGIEVWSPPRDLRLAACRMDRVLAVSRYTRDRMAAWGVDPTRIHVLPDTVDGEVFRPLSPTSRREWPLLLTVARLDSAERSKGIDHVIRILPALRSRFPGIAYAIAGTGSDVMRLRRLAAGTGVDEAVHFLGPVTDEQLPRVLSEADLFVMPSRKEGFGIVFIEAMACGTPVIACGLEGSRDALLDGRVGTLINPDVPGELAQAVEAALKHPAASIDSESLRSEVLAAFGSDSFRELVRGYFSGSVTS